MTTSSRRPYREFGAWLRSRRLARRWTQEDLARRLHYDVTYVRKIEWGERRPSEALRVRLAQVLGVPVSSLPTSLPSTPPGRVPAAAGDLIGRDADMAAIMDLFDQGARLVTLLGAPGIGKTRLALALASMLDDRLPGGARFIPLVEVDSGGVARAMAQVLGVDLSPGDDDVRRLVDALRAQEMLLVLDNFEHVVEAAPLVGELVARVPTLRVLVTSRHRLDLRLETQYALPPLALPAGPEDGPDDGPERLSPERLSPERLGAIASVALFVARARNARPDFTLDEANAAGVAEVCARLQGIPLAIELAAGAARFLTPKAMLDQLGDGLDLPVAGPLDGPEHHRTLRAAIGWSFELLAPEEHIMMRRLAVFAGGCTLDGAASVCRLPDEQALDPRRELLALASKSLLQPVTDAEGGPRFVALEAVRGFAYERLVASGEPERFHRRHASWALELARDNEQRLTGSQQTQALGVFEAEHANLRAAIRWSLDHDPQTAIRLCGGLWRFWWMRGHLAEGRQWLESALAQAHPDEAAYAPALAGAGVLARTQGAYGPAVERLERAATLSRDIDDRGTLALSLLNLGNVAQDRGEHALAVPLFEEARGLYEASGNLRGVGHSLNCLGTAALGKGGLEPSADLFEEALSIFRELGDHWSVAMVLTNLGWVAHKQGRGPLARAFYEKALALYRAVGDDRGVALLLVNLGVLGKGADGSDGGAGLFEEALLTFSRLGERRGVAECLEALAVARSGSDPRRASVLLGGADALRDGIGAPRSTEDQAMLAGVLDGIRARLRSFDVAWQQGRMMEVEDLVAVALTTQEHEPGP